MQFPLPSQVWQGLHLLLQTPFEHTWQCLESQQLVPHTVFSAGHWVQTPETQFPLRHSAPWMHWALIGNVPGN